MSKRRWRGRVLLVGVIVLTAAGILLLAGSRPRAQPVEDGEEPTEASPGRPWPARLYPLNGGVNSASRDGKSEPDPDQEPDLQLTIINDRSGQPLAQTSIRLRRCASVQATGTGRLLSCGLVSLPSDPAGAVWIPAAGLANLESLTVKASGFDDRELPPAALEELKFAGSAEVRLTPTATLVARLLAEDGTPYQEFEVCLLVEGEPDCQQASEGEVSVDELPAGEHRLWAVAPPAADGSQPLAVETISLQPGESRRVDFRARTESGHRLAVRLVDQQGRAVPSGTMEVSLALAAGSMSPTDEELLAVARQSKVEESDGVSWRVRKSGWYRLRATARLGPDAPLVEKEIFVGDGEVKATLVVSDAPVRCTLIDPSGRTLPYTGYRVTFKGPDGDDGFGGGSSQAQDALYLYWPRGVDAIEVRLNGPARGRLLLRSPRQSCQLTASP